MEDQTLTHSIEKLGAMIEELNYWVSFEDDVYADKKFDEALEAVIELREEVLNRIEGYLHYVKENHEPICLIYVRVKKELQHTTFSSR